MDDNLLHSALGSATAGVISRIFTHPLDTAKARLQAPPSATRQTGVAKIKPYNGPFDVLRRTARTEGVKGLYRGFGAILVGGTPGTMVYLCGYELIKQRLTSFSSPGEIAKGDVPDFFIHFASGMLAETIACIVYVPVDVVKERLQVQRHQETIGGESNTRQYNGSYDALRKILRNEGLSGIYKGYAATLVSFGPFSALYFGLYELCKDEAASYIAKQTNGNSAGSLPIFQSLDDAVPTLEEHEVLPFPYLVACSAGAGAVASWLTSPLDMAKLRLQVQRGKAAAAASGEQAPGEISLSYRGMVDCLRRAYIEGGIRGLFRGAGARVMHFTPATCITMTCYEKCRSFYARTLSGDFWQFKQGR